MKNTAAKQEHAEKLSRTWVRKGSHLVPQGARLTGKLGRDSAQASRTVACEFAVADEWHCPVRVRNTSQSINSQQTESEKDKTMKEQANNHSTPCRTLRRYSIIAGGAALVAGSMLTLIPWSQAEDAAENPPAKVKVSEEPTSSDGGYTRSYAQVVKKVIPSVVKVEVSKPVEEMVGRMPDLPFFRNFPGQDPRGQSGPRARSFKAPMEQGAGSGVLVTEDGYILTNNHVVEDAEKISVTLTDGRKFTAKVVGRDPQTDIAVIKVDSQDLPAITLANSDRIEVGDVVLAVGNPFGLGQTVTSGIVSAKGRATLGLDYEDFIQTDAAINPGNSGGALVDADGRLVGINTAILSRSGGNQGIGFAVPVNLARWVMDGLVENGSVQRGFLGVMIQDVNAGLAQAFDLGEVQGALVSEVTPDSPADKAGLKSGDVITEFDGKSVEDSRRLKLAVGATEPGKTVEVTVIREGKPETFKIALKKVPGARMADGSPSLGSRGEALAGVGVADLDGEARKMMNLPQQVQGVVVTQVEESSPAHEAGLRPGDVITEINRNAVKDADEAMAACEKSQDVTLVKIWRGGVSRYLVVDETQEG